MRHRIGIRILCLVVGAVLFLTLGAVAQENATITGVVTDPSGAVVPTATITLTNPATSQARNAVSNTSGIYTFSNVGIGHFTLSAVASGFQTFTRTDIVVNVAQNLKEDIGLSVGSQGQTVTVRADALQLQSETSELSTLISGEQVSQLATNGRNVTALAALGMGVSNNLPAFGGVNALTSANGISFNGTRVSHNIYMLDGGELNDRGCGGCFSSLPSIDALAQFQTLDSNYGPDYGIGSGGTILMVLKSGARDFHGEAYYFNRNEDYDANNYFTKLAKQPRPIFRLNEPGFNIGGPVWIPHVYNEERNRTFFFVNEEWRRLIQGSSPNTVNTIAANNFPVAGQPFTYHVPSNGMAPIVPATSDPAKLAIYGQHGLTPGQPFPNNTIPAALLDP
ncbi:MAG: carboxypeptidase regulatory-like domain-containing protein, partial [Bryobacteraceae bacterium]